MKFRFKFNATIEKGKFEIKDKNRWELTLKSLQGSKELVELDLFIQKKINQRSNAQNALYWFYLGVISKDTGHTTDELHIMFKSRLLKKRIEVKGQKFVIIGSTTRLSTLEFIEYLEHIIRISAEMDIALPDPNTINLDY